MSSSTVQRVNKICELTIVYGFYFTQCVCTGSIECSTLVYYVLLVEQIIIWKCSSPFPRGHLQSLIDKRDPKESGLVHENSCSMGVTIATSRGK